MKPDLDPDGVPAGLDRAVRAVAGGRPEELPPHGMGRAPARHPDVCGALELMRDPLELRALSPGCRRLGFGRRPRPAIGRRLTRPSQPPSANAG